MLKESVSPDLVAAEIAKACREDDIRRAASRYNGKGMQDGVDMVNTLRTLRGIKDNKDQVAYCFKAALETIISGACWPAALPGSSKSC